MAQQTKTARSILGIQMPSGTAAHAVSRNLANAAQSVGEFGEGMGSLAAEIRRVRKGSRTLASLADRRSRSCSKV